jgi:bacteriocin biosynthesis cyclodehydratase domain-containing protein
MGIRVLTVGSFGAAVARHLEKIRTDVVDVTDALHKCEMRADVSVNVVAAWRPVPQLCEAADEFSYCHKQTFIPLILDSHLVRLGPVTTPYDSSGGCWACWMLRSKQHDPWEKERSVLNQYYASHPDSGPEGYLEPIAAIGAARIAWTVDASDRSCSIAGQIWQFNTITLEIVHSKVIGVHDCSRCGLKRPARDRSISDIKHQLGYLWERPERK